MKLADVLTGAGARPFRTTATGLVEGIAGSQLSLEFDSFASDSRAVTAGSIFFALTGDCVDGHSFVESALRGGASAVVVKQTWLDQRAPPTFPANRLVLATADPLDALQQLASFWREKHTVVTVGVTGSLGKTTVKEAVAQVLAADDPARVLKTTGNLNTEIGLPLELLRLDERHRFAVLEMGMYQRGDIALLTRIARPEIGVVTNVQANHLSRTGSLTRTAQAKAELVHALPPWGTSVLNGDDALVRAMGADSRASSLYFGHSRQLDYSASVTRSLGRRGFAVTIRHGSKDMTVTCPLPGAHNALNLLPAVAIGHRLGVEWNQIRSALGHLTLPGRMEYVEGPNGSTILDDRYNASGASMLAALALLGQEKGRRLALLGEMYELGDEEESQHRLVGKHVRDVDFLILLGTKTRWIAEEAKGQGMDAARIVTVGDNEQAIQAARDALRPGDVMLVKGSRGLHLEYVVSALTGREPTSH